MSVVSVGLLWRWIFEPEDGILDVLLYTIGLQNYAQAWLGDKVVALISIMMVNNWEWTGFYMVVMLAAIKGIPQEIYDSGKIDGITEFKSHIYITIPLIKDVMIALAIYAWLTTLRFFDLVWVMTRGGPNHATESLAVYIYRATFEKFQLGYGSSVAFLLFLFCVATAVILLGLTRRGEAIEY